MVKKNSTKTKVQPYEIGELDHYLFGQGNHYEIYKKMGAHEVTKNGKRGMGSSCSKRFCNRRV
jgi:1,4-alpha-glucan branching enzyme